MAGGGVMAARGASWQRAPRLPSLWRPLSLPHAQGQGGEQRPVSLGDPGSTWDGVCDSS